jgi:multidrug resistance efflux pump
MKRVKLSVPPAQPGQPAASSDQGGTEQRPAENRYRWRALAVIGSIVLVLLAWWLAGYLMAYTDDAYVSSDIVSISPEVSGPVTSVAIGDNQFVSRGQALFTIDPEPFELDLKQARAQEAQAAAQLEIDRSEYEYMQAEARSAEAALQLARLNLERERPLNESGVIPSQALDHTRSTLAQAEAQQRAAQANVRKAEHVLLLHKTSLASAQALRALSEWRRNRTQVSAPIDGYITHLTLQRGDMAQVARASLAIVDTHTWRVIANYKEYYLRHLKNGGTAWVWLDTHPWRLYRARIQGVARGITRAEGGESLVPYVSPTVNWIRLQRRVPVRLTLIDSPDPRELFAGTDARVLVIY